MMPVALSLDHESKALSVSLSTNEEMISKRRKELFGDCALIEIIHLHDCLRGALRALESDMGELLSAFQRRCYPDVSLEDSLADLERRVNGRFKVIWSVFRAHSKAEDEFIWPALRLKTQGKIGGSPKYQPGEDVQPAVASENTTDGTAIEQEEYEEDHADEERMFSEMDTLLTMLREKVVQEGRGKDSIASQQTPLSSRGIGDMASKISERTRSLSKHLMTHLEKEETQCMPLVVKHLSKSEIHELVGNIMGKRSADTIAQIMTMAVQNLDEADREEMVKYMKQSMAGTFFDRWLLMSGWMSSSPGNNRDEEEVTASKRSASSAEELLSKRAKLQATASSHQSSGNMPILVPSSTPQSSSSGQITSQAELEKLIRAIASNHALSDSQKNTTIQGLRDSVWKSNERQKNEPTEVDIPTVVNASIPVVPTFRAQTAPVPNGVVPASAPSRTRRVTPPSMYYSRTEEGKVELVWVGNSPSSRLSESSSVPLFSAAELAPSHHDGAAGSVLGCPHYARACKLRHPKSGRLYTCRLCCEQQRELPMRDQDDPLDRYAVTEVMCMQCNALQPAEDRCVNQECESRGKPYARYFCRICHLYDDGTRPIFHCPYCNTCRLGLGLGIDFRHCMRCNACVALSDEDHHCIPQKLQGSCPICHESLFQSTEPLRGLKCGHVMHMACFTEYRRGQSYTCPLCMRSMEDMKDYFALLDTAVRMQPMPAAYLSTKSNIYCQDCGKTGQVPYHFVGQKCHCGSYNTREMGRVDASPVGDR